ncbi:hypothetical protein BDV93DRAFT_528425 [Ceratobasidium sp. AG-I]|nr:hypothetical protein BDV93DRAFT_528425 [Ceratobasidium sp. AG-I]
MASRRESRMYAAQNDALLEFENFKKKYLLVNKHVTKLNSTLSIRIEELNVQLSKLQVENLRLRTANISLAAQVKRERNGKGRDPRTVALVEAATAEALRQLTAIRNAILPSAQPSPQSPHSIPTPPSSSPTTAPIRISGPVHPTPSTRLPVARAPEFASLVESSETPYGRRRSSGGITEDSDSEMEHHARVATQRPTPGAHRMPAPVYQQEVVVELKARRPVRRQSGMLARGAAGSTLDVEEDNGREPSPANDLDTELMGTKSAPSDSDSKRSKRKLVESEPEDAIKSVGVIVDLPDENGLAEMDEENEVLKQLQHARPRGLASGDKLRDVTNSPRRTIVQKMKKDKEKFVEEEPVSMGYVGTPAVNKTKPRSRTLIPTPMTGSGRLTPIPSSIPDEDPSVGGRERRARKSVNYAEPKLNTKMRKPTPDATSLGPRTSLPAIKPRSSSSTLRDRSPSPDSPMPHLLETLPSTKSESVTSKSESVSSRAESGNSDAGVTTRPARRRRAVTTTWEDMDADDIGEEDADDEYVPQGGGVRRKSAAKAGERRHSSAV